MATQSADNPALTRAQKRQNTIAEREENARPEQKAFEAEAKKTGGRQAKVVAKINAVWNVDNPKSRKRTSSTAKAPDNVKKARESVAQSDAEDDLVESESEEAQAKGSKTKRSGRLTPGPSRLIAEPLGLATQENLGFVPFCYMYKQRFSHATLVIAN
ncbi:hypothetical protein B0H11DRAFT_2366940 [Mycena galericulata]|nr:hypothetical protein B0H11DRAFT_2366940 [Mycena galericulata]